REPVRFHPPVEHLQVVDVGPVPHDQRFAIDNALEVGALNAPVHRITIDPYEEGRRLGKEDLEPRLSVIAASTRAEQKQREADSNQRGQNVACPRADCPWRFAFHGESLTSRYRPSFGPQRAPRLANRPASTHAVHLPRTP